MAHRQIDERETILKETEMTREERLKRIMETIGPECVHNDVIVANFLHLLRAQPEADIDDGMARLCRILAQDRANAYRLAADSPLVRSKPIWADQSRLRRSRP